jgi:hypothetical protein
MNRPSHRELFGKLRAARAAVEKGQVALLNQMALAADAIELDYSIGTELNAVLVELLEGTTPLDYTGSRPPQRSYEQDIEGLELFAFSVDSKRFKCRVYLKFAIAEEMFWLVSLHQDRPTKEEP